ncbi:MAG: hypothetical protein IFK93_15095 [Acidobacteria bacterium]|nr:hypothetical protein [Candidatus Sulfomarinibacter kjeldsenii]MBD3855172.1 hypothetical protein [Candidatus Sulfomarinibacter kjeldsenii]
MTHNKSNMEARHETASGSLERITFSAENSGEKSLLTLIEEHRPEQTENPPGKSSELSWDSSANAADDLEEEGYRLEHSLMRLGGNGF